MHFSPSSTYLWSMHKHCRIRLNVFLVLWWFKFYFPSVNGNRGSYHRRHCFLTSSNCVNIARIPPVGLSKSIVVMLLFLFSFFQKQCFWHGPCSCTLTNSSGGWAPVVLLEIKYTIFCCWLCEKKKWGGTDGNGPLACPPAPPPGKPCVQKEDRGWQDKVTACIWLELLFFS